MGTVSSLRLDSFIGGDVDVRVTNLVVGDKANISGSLTYDSFNTLDRSLNATLTSEPVRNDPVVSLPEGNRFGFLVPSLMGLFSILCWYLISRKTLNSVVDKALAKSPKPVLIGFAVLFFAPVAALILILSMIGSLIGFIILFAYLLILLLALVAMPAILGQMLMLAFTKNDRRVTLLSLVIGVLVIAILSQLPLLGAVFMFVLALIGIGALVVAVYSLKSQPNQI